MSDIIAQYQRWKQQGGDLRAKAKTAMEERFRELLTEAAGLADEYHKDFGAQLKPPPSITAFRYRTGKAKAPAKAAQAPGAAKPGPKTAGLERRLATAKAKLEAARAAGKPTRDIDDKIYEIEDALRLAQSSD